MLGTTEKKYDEPVIDPKVDFDNHLWMVKEISNYFNQIEAVEISKSVKSKWAGLRPLVLDDSAFKPDGTIDTKKVSRNHVVESVKF